MGRGALGAKGARINKQTACTHLEHTQVAACGLVLLRPAHCGGGRTVSHSARPVTGRAPATGHASPENVLAVSGYMVEGALSSSISLIFCIVVILLHRWAYGPVQTSRLSFL